MGHGLSQARQRRRGNFAGLRLHIEHVAIGRSAETLFYTNVGARRLAISTGGTLTGRDGDLMFIDDPPKA